jgi:hypothetical protein
MARKRRLPPPATMPPPVERCLSLIEPCATLLTRGFAPVLVRPYGVSYKGPLWIHSASRWDEEIKSNCNIHAYIFYKELGFSKCRPLPLGCVVGRAVLSACDTVTIGYSDTDEEVTDILSYKIYHERGSYGFRYAWKFEDIQFLEYKDRIVMTKTWPGLFRVDPIPTDALQPARPPWTIPPLSTTTIAVDEVSDA